MEAEKIRCFQSDKNLFRETLHGVVSTTLTTGTRHTRSDPPEVPAVWPAAQPT